jgi:uncharacterized membrane protein
MRRQWLSLTLVVAAFAVAAALYPWLPPSVPTHWNWRGEPDGFMPKSIGAFLMPLTMAGVWGLFAALPWLSPRGYRIDRFRGAFDVMQAATLAFLLFVHVLALCAALGRGVAMNRALALGLGLLLMVVGNFLGKVTRNFFVGIRTPWTLASDEVWLRTHRFGGRLFVGAGLLAVAAAALDWGLAPALAAVLAAALGPAVYSFLLYRRIEPR